MTLSSPEPTVRPLPAGTPFGRLVEARPGLGLDQLAPGPLLGLAREHRLLLLRGFRPPAGAAELTAFGQRLGEVPVWEFGPVLELVEQDVPSDGVFGNNWLPFHWDGMFLPQVPEFQLFHCVSAPGADQGGRTLFCDTSLALAGAAPRQRAAWAATTITYTIGKAAHYGGLVRTPVVVPHPDRGTPTMRYHEPVPDGVDYPNPITLHHDGGPGLERSLREALHDPRACYAHSWRTGDVVIADNYTLLHGREPYTRHAGRHLRRVHVMGDPPLANPALAGSRAGAGGPA